jgi:hypothetical protein
MSIDDRITKVLDLLPPELRDQSGSVFYTGSQAFTGSKPLYVLGLNPGGDPIRQSDETIGKHLAKFQARSTAWSEYIDESWLGAPAGTWGLQPRILHMLNGLGLDPRATPASNLVFARTRTEAYLGDGKDELMRACWPVHQAVIDALAIKVILCFGSTVGRFVRDRLGVTDLIDSYVEENDRRWKSLAHFTPDIIIITASHPGRANWCNPFSDPTPLVRRALHRAGIDRPTSS